MDTINLNFPSWEFINENFNRLYKEIQDLKDLLKNKSTKALKFYRTKDLKYIFGLSDNTIEKYRENGTLPFTKIGEIFYYPVEEISEILKNNSNFDGLSVK